MYKGRNKGKAQMQPMNPMGNGNAWNKGMQMERGRKKEEGMKMRRGMHQEGIRI